MSSNELDNLVRIGKLKSEPPTQMGDGVGQPAEGAMNPNRRKPHRRHQNATACPSRLGSLAAT